MSERESQRLSRAAARRAGREAALLEMLADAEGLAPQTAAMARVDRIVAAELEMEAEYLSEGAGDHGSGAEDLD